MITATPQWRQVLPFKLHFDQHYPRSSRPSKTRATNRQQDIRIGSASFISRHLPFFLIHSMMFPHQFTPNTNWFTGPNFDVVDTISSGVDTSTTKRSTQKHIEICVASGKHNFSILFGIAEAILVLLYCWKSYFPCSIERWRWRVGLLKELPRQREGSVLRLIFKRWSPLALVITQAQTVYHRGWVRKKKICCCKHFQCSTKEWVKKNQMGS